MAAIPKLLRLILGQKGTLGPTVSKPPVARMPTVRAPERLVGGIPEAQSSQKNKLLKKSKATFRNPQDNFVKNKLS